MLMVSGITSGGLVSMISVARLSSILALNISSIILIKRRLKEIDAYFDVSIYNKLLLVSSLVCLLKSIVHFDPVIRRASYQRLIGRT